MANARKELRDKTVGAKKDLKNRIVEWDGDKFEIRQPTVSLRAKIMQKSRIPTGGDAEDIIAQVDYSVMQVWSVIYCTYVPDTDERVFEDQDAKSLREQPTGGFVDQFAEAATDLMNVSPKQAAKNSEQMDESS